MSLSPEEKRALRKGQGLLAGTRQWSMPRLSYKPRSRRRAHPAVLFAGSLVVGLAVIAGVFFAARWLGLL